jgi:hypothetical protein
VNFRIEHLYAFVAVDRNDGDEGVVAFYKNGTWFPLVAADNRRLEKFRELAQEVAQRTGQLIRLVRFETRVEVETLARRPPSS